MLTALFHQKGRWINVSWVARPRGRKWVDQVRTRSESDPDSWHWSMLKYLVNIKGVSDRSSCKRTDADIYFQIKETFTLS